MPEAPTPGVEDSHGWGCSAWLKVPTPGVCGLGATGGAGRGMWAGRGQEKEQRGPRAPSGGFTHCLPQIPVSQGHSIALVKG